MITVSWIRHHHAHDFFAGRADDEHLNAVRHQRAKQLLLATLQPGHIDGQLLHLVADKVPGWNRLTAGQHGVQMVLEFAHREAGKNLGRPRIPHLIIDLAQALVIAGQAFAPVHGVAKRDQRQCAVHSVACKYTAHLHERQQRTEQVVVVGGVVGVEHGIGTAVCVSRNQSGQWYCSL